MKNHTMTIPYFLNTPTHFTKINGIYFIVDCWNDRILYNRKAIEEVSEWKVLNNFKKPHRIRYRENKYYICDTDNNQIVVYDKSLNKRNVLDVGFDIEKPHDLQCYKQFIYIVDCYQETSRLLRYNFDDKRCSIVYKFEKQYIRSLKIIDNILYLCGSSSGNFVKIDLQNDSHYAEIIINNDSNFFASLSYEEQKKYGIKRFVPNDIEYYEGFFYITNYFYGDTKNKFIRFRNFNDLKENRYDDLSSFFIGIPYYMEIVDKTLFVGEIDTHSSVKVFRQEINSFQIKNNIEGIKLKLNLDYYTGTDHYSDGDIEDELLDMVKSKKPVDEILAEDNRWAILYHLSPIRQNILNWYPFKGDASVLEIGGGCGAITGALCDRASEVKVVELSRRRSTINLERNKHHDNLEIIVGNLNDIKFDQKFDYITLIGVLEYAGAFTKTDKPYEDFLKKIKSLLKEDGKLLIAIENRYGMKYFAGAKEDHTGKEFDGITGYIDNDSVRTFGKVEIEELLEKAGLSQKRFYYPHPDYKMPFEIFSDELLPTNEELLSRTPNFDSDRYEFFNESVAFKGIIENNQFAFFANSFLIECGV